MVCRPFYLAVCPSRSKTNALNICQKMIEMFVRTKHKIDKRHEFALVVVNDDALWVSTEPFYNAPDFLHSLLTTYLQHAFLECGLFLCLHVRQLSGFTSDPRELCSCLYDLETNVCETFSILMSKINLKHLK